MPNFRTMAIEAMARAIWETWSNSDQAKPDVRGLSWDALLQGAADGMTAGIRLAALAREEATAALNALATLAAAQGVKMVGREPTSEQDDACRAHPTLGTHTCNDVWPTAHGVAKCLLSE